MYHGIVQERQWSGPGTYIRARIEQYDLDKVVHYGRIWRLVYDGVKPASDAARTRQDRAAHEQRDGGAARRRISVHPNGWWRDTAQQLLVLKQDKSVVPALQTIVKTSPQPARRASTRCGRSKDWARSTRRWPAS